MTQIKAKMLRRMKDAEQAERYDDTLTALGLKRGADYRVLYPWTQGNGWYQFVSVAGGAEINGNDRAFASR